MEINIEKIGGKNKVVFTEKNRTFILDYELDDLESKLIADALVEAFKSFNDGGGDIKTSYKQALNLDSVIVPVCPNCKLIQYTRMGAKYYYCHNCGHNWQTEL